jgi:hypothetical protein
MLVEWSEQDTRDADRLCRVLAANSEKRKTLAGGGNGAGSKLQNGRDVPAGQPSGPANRSECRAAHNDASTYDAIAEFRASIAASAVSKVPK